MKYFLILSFFISASIAGVKEDMYHLYQSKQYEQACSLGLKNFGNNRRDEEYVSLYAFSCLKADYIDRLFIPISTLKRSEEARANAAYLSVILMQKKLLYHALIDGHDISSLKLPTTDYILSKIFDLYIKDDHSRKRGVYIYNDPDSKKITYKLFVIEKNGVKKMVIEEYYDTIVANRHEYW